MTVKNLTVAEAVAQENQRVMGILNCQEAKGREQLAQELAGLPGMTVEQAKTLLAAAPAAGSAGAGEQIMALPEAKGREQLAQELAGLPGMTVEQAKTLLAAAPAAGSAGAGEQIMALPEAKGREQLAQALAGQPGMTVEQAKTLLAAAPQASQLTQENLFDRFMAQHSPCAVSGGGAAGSGEENMLLSMP